MRIYTAITAILLTCTLAAAQASYKVDPHKLTPRPMAEASSTVRQYCQLDFHGDRLDSASWMGMKPLTTWEDNPDFQAVTVVSFFQVASVKSEGDRALVTVVYDVIGRFEIGIGYFPEQHSETGVFELQDPGSKWKIKAVEPSSIPRISRQRALSWLTSEMNAEKDPAFKATLKKAVAELQKLPKAIQTSSQK